MKLSVMIMGIAAVAGSAMADVSGSGLVVLHTSASGALSMVGNSTVRIPARAVYVNSSSGSAVKTTGNATLDTPTLYVVGGTSFGGNSGCTGDVVQSVAPYADPYSGLAFPSESGMTTFPAKSISGGNVTLAPGYYSGGISITGNANVTLSPGVFLIAGSGLKVTSGSISGQGVSLVIKAGTLDVAGNSTFTLSPPTSGSMSGVVISQPPTNGNEMKLAGGSGMMIRGGIYVPGAMLTMVGNSSVEGQGPQMGDLVVASKVTLKGTAIIQIGQPAAPAISLPTLPLFD